MGGIPIVLGVAMAVAGLNQPGAVAANASSAIEIDVSWNDTSSTESGFEIRRSTTGAGGTYAAIATTGANATRYADLGLSASTQYCYTIVAFRTTSGKNSYSSASAAACATTLAPPIPAAPSNTAAVAVSDTRIDVAWQDNSSNETGFEIHRSTTGPTGTFSLAASTAAGTVGWSDTGLAAATQYCYRVRAFATATGKTSYSDLSPAACATTAAPVPPAPPSNARVYPFSNYRMDVYWQDNSISETGFELHRSVDGPTGSFVLIASTAANVTSATDLGLSPSTQYCYKVRAVRTGAGASDFSNTACATTGAPPGVHVTMATTGEDLPRFDYEARIWKDFGDGLMYVEDVSLPVTGSVTLSDLDPATPYRIAVIGFPLNCAVTSANPQTFETPLSWQPGITIQFDVECTPPAQLAFATTNGDNADIFVVNSDVTGMGALTSDPAWDVAPAWSPDGTKIAFQSNRGGTPEIWLMNADGSNPAQITSTGGSFRPAWSPDGTRIAFTSARDGSDDVFVVNADGTGLVNLTNDPAADADPAWSPDGTKIAFRSDRDGSGYSAIYLMNPDGSGVTRLTADSYVSDSQPSWSPDGSLLAVSRYWCSEWCIQTIWLMSPADGSAGAVSALEPDCEVHGDPAWSPDGKEIAFTNTTICTDDGSAFSSVNVLRLGIDDSTEGVPIAPGSGASWKPVR